MTNNTQNAAIVSAGMRLLREKLGLIECEIFISSIRQDRFDYTKWREDLYEDMTIQEIHDNAKAYMRDNSNLLPKNAALFRR